jgi:drug/metabolite transporter (DMT)-like permease
MLRLVRLPPGPLSGLGIPIVFVLIWSTGFIVAKAVAPHADLQLYLVVRLSLTALLMGAAGVLVGAKWPTGRGVWPHLLAGALMQGVYLCASYWAIARGLVAGVMSLLGALQPRMAASVQNFGGACIAVLVTWGAGTGQWDGSVVLWGALAWAVLVPSVIGTTLLMWMMRHGEATKVTALLLLVPPLAAVQAYLFFHETLSRIQLVGFALALFGVLLTRSAPKQL